MNISITKTYEIISYIYFLNIQNTLYESAFIIIHVIHYHSFLYPREYCVPLCIYNFHFLSLTEDRLVSRGNTEQLTLVKEIIVLRQLRRHFGGQRVSRTGILSQILFSPFFSISFTQCCIFRFHSSKSH